MKQRIVAGFTFVCFFFLLFSCNDESTPLFVSEGDGDDLEEEIETSDIPQEGEDDTEATAFIPPTRPAYQEERAPCADFNPLKNLYFGDMHAHTRISWDAYGYEVRATLEEAYGFAKGEPVRLAPLDENGVGQRVATIDRPLDFVAMSDHIEFVADYYLCHDPESEVYDTGNCHALREGGQSNVMQFGLKLADEIPDRMGDICRNTNLCKQMQEKAWADMIEAAENAYDKSERCEFTTFPAYEYTGTPNVVNMHRNIFFLNGQAPLFPPSYFDAPTPKALWDTLETSCLEALPGCDVMVIPHNSNWSNGHLFTPDYSDAETKEEMARLASQRLKMEPVFEMFQHKGDMECKNGFEGVPLDPLCDFEKIREADFIDCKGTPGALGANHYGCLSKNDYLRNVLKLGLIEEQRIGVNPYKIGMIAATDSHNGTPGLVMENAFGGHVGTTDDTPEKRLGNGTITHKPKVYNPGGLTAVWALENSREAIFQAIRNRETYATSGTRIKLRLFAGSTLDFGLCSDANALEKAYAAGVPMGGELTGAPASALRFFVFAEKDDKGGDAPAAGLQRIQIIKGWLDDDGQTHEEVFDVAGDKFLSDTANKETCKINEKNAGFERLCTVFEDAQFNPDEPAFYYARVLEIPTCRWSAYDCATFDDGEKPAICTDSGATHMIQERAWSSPIWYHPKNR